ncbi:MAG: hypothetical protein PHH84_01075 [Oscillospiraceae bacterium]|nr:hypothetical protein [Oscillospiraceae bacterium]MDD4413855.1 hypothetical protein [Oscillospiraceae bacterium]
MKKLITAISAALMLFMSGCSFFFPGLDESDEQSDSGSGIDYSSEYDGKWCYQRLSPQLKIGYGEIYAAVIENFDIDNTVTITDSELGTEREYNGLRVELSRPLKSNDDAKRLYTAFVSDNPQFFYIGNTYSFEGYRTGRTDHYNVFCIVFTMTAQERSTASVRLEDAISQIRTSLINSSPSGQFETELFLHDELARICSYENRASDTVDPITLYPNAFTAYGALVEGLAVCEGYSRAMQLLLHRSGIEATLVGGFDMKGVAHMWNLVTIDGRNYHLDPTWNDNSDRLHHSYFNLTTDEILKSHTIDSDNIGVDTCTAVEANYYLRNGRLLDTVKRDEIADVIARAVIHGEMLIDLRFAENTFAGARLFINNRELLIQKVNSKLKGTGFSMWNYDEYNVNDIYHTLTLYKE